MYRFNFSVCKKDKVNNYIKVSINSDNRKDAFKKLWCVLCVDSANTPYYADIDSIQELTLKLADEGIITEGDK